MIRQYETDWFVANDIAAHLGYANATLMLNKVHPSHCRQLRRRTDRWLVNREGALELMPHLDSVLEAERNALRDEFDIDADTVAHIPGALEKLRTIAQMQSDPTQELLVTKGLMEYFSTREQVTSDDLGEHFGIRLGFGKPITRARVLLDRVGININRDRTVRRGGSTRMTFALDSAHFVELYLKLCQ